MQIQQIQIQIRNPAGINHIFCYSLEKFKQTEQKKLKINNKLDISHS
jgi:hypothetical protein